MYILEMGVSVMFRTWRKSSVRVSCLGWGITIGEEFAKALQGSGALPTIALCSCLISFDHRFSTSNHDPAADSEVLLSQVPPVFHSSLSS